MAGSHGRELWFDTDLGDEYIYNNNFTFQVPDFYCGALEGSHDPSSIAGYTNIHDLFIVALQVSIITMPILYFWCFPHRGRYNNLEHNLEPIYTSKETTTHI